MTQFELTFANRQLLCEVLLADIEANTRTSRGSKGYLDRVDSLPDNALVTDDDDVWDVVEYFQLQNSLE